MTLHHSTQNIDPGGVYIDYDALRNQFTIICPAYANGRVRDLPNRRWDSKHKFWRAQALKANVRVMVKHFPPKCFTKAANDKIDAMSVTSGGVMSMFPDLFPFKTSPLEKQRVALDMFYGSKSVALFMDMGTGKTKVVTDLFTCWNGEGTCNRILVMSPMSVRKTWIREIEKHSNTEFDVHLLDASKEKKFHEFNTTPHPAKVLIVGVESLSAGRAFDLCKKFLVLSVQSLVVCDESSRIKNAASTRTKNAISLARMAERRIIMNGTPIANGLVDLFAQYEFLDPEIIGIGDVYSFRARYCVMGGYEDREIIGYQNIDELMELIKPHTYQVRSDEVMDLPPLVFERREVKMPDDAARLYREINRKSIVGITDEKDPVKNSLTKSLRLQQIANGIGQVITRNGDEVITTEQWLGSPKVDELIALIEDNPDKQFLIWGLYISQIREVAAVLRGKYGNSTVVELHGGVDEEQRDVNVYELFQKRKARFCVGNVATGGMGLTMTEADFEVYLSNSFNFIDREQSIKRAHRKGRVGTVVVVDIVTEGTVDVDACEALAMKLNFSEYIRGAIAGKYKLEGLQPC